MGSRAHYVAGLENSAFFNGTIIANARLKKKLRQINFIRNW